MTELAPWFALIAMVGALGCVLGALLARALFVMCVYLAAAGALASVALALMHGGAGALVVALTFAGLAPVLMLGAVLLSTRAAKAQRRARPWLSVGASLAVAATVFWGLPELGATATAPRDAPQPEFIGAWIAPLIFVAVVACVGLLGYGERGALQRPADGEV